MASLQSQRLLFDQQLQDAIKIKQENKILFDYPITENLKVSFSFLTYKSYKELCQCLLGMLQRALSSKKGDFSQEDQLETQSQIFDHTEGQSHQTSLFMHEHVKSNSVQEKIIENQMNELRVGLKAACRDVQAKEREILELKEKLKEHKDLVEKFEARGKSREKSAQRRIDESQKLKAQAALIEGLNEKLSKKVLPIKVQQIHQLPDTKLLKFEKDSLQAQNEQYVKTLEEIGMVLQEESDDLVLQEFKKLNEQHLKENFQLQEEILKLKNQISSQSTSRNSFISNQGEDTARGRTASRVKDLIGRTLKKRPPSDMRNYDLPMQQQNQTDQSSCIEKVLNKQNENADLQELRETQQKLREKEQEISLVNLESSELKVQIKKLKSEMETINKEKGEVESKVTEILREYNNIKSIFEQEVEKKDQVVDNYNQVQKNYDEIAEQYQELQEAYETLKKLFDSEKEVYAEELQTQDLQLKKIEQVFKTKEKLVRQKLLRLLDFDETAASEQVHLDQLIEMIFQRVQKAMCNQVSSQPAPQIQQNQSYIQAYNMPYQRTTFQETSSYNDPSMVKHQITGSFGANKAGYSKMNQENQEISEIEQNDETSPEKNPFIETEKSTDKKITVISPCPLEEIGNMNEKPEKPYYSSFMCREKKTTEGSATKENRIIPVDVLNRIRSSKSNSRQRSTDVRTIEDLPQQNLGRNLSRNTRKNYVIQGAESNVTFHHQNSNGLQVLESQQDSYQRKETDCQSVCNRRSQALQERAFRAETQPAYLPKTARNMQTSHSSFTPHTHLQAQSVYSGDQYSNYDDQGAFSARSRQERPVSLQEEYENFKLHLPQRDRNYQQLQQQQQAYQSEVLDSCSDAYTGRDILSEQNPASSSHRQSQRSSSPSLPQGSINSILANFKREKELFNRKFNILKNKLENVSGGSHEE